MNRFLNYIVLDEDGTRGRITGDDIDAEAVARVVETLESVSCGARALLTLRDATEEAAAVVDVCIKSRAGPPLWKFLRANAVNEAGKEAIREFLGAFHREFQGAEGAGPQDELIENYTVYAECNHAKLGKACVTITAQKSVSGKDETLNISASGLDIDPQ